MIEKKPKLLYVEDDETLSFVTSENLERKGYQVVQSPNGMHAMQLFMKETFDLIILDIMLPKMDGFTVARKIREINMEIPILFVTAKSLKEDRLKGLMLGGDDYIVKPFSIEELVLKIEVFLRRAKITNSHTQPYMISLGKLKLDMNNLNLSGPEGDTRITQREAELLKFFVINKNRLMTREVILAELWGGNDYFSGRSLDVFISRLRKYLKPEPLLKIENKHGVGFIFKEEKE